MAKTNTADIGFEKEIWKANEPRFRHCRILPV